jgi:UDP-N-acetylmuramoyl-tripeptide--D-alanyl-D-alanine ligase
VPLTLLGAGPEHDFLVAEIGTNHPGEIAELAAIVRPDIAVITSIGEEHLEFFKDLPASPARSRHPGSDRGRRHGHPPGGTPTAGAVDHARRAAFAIQRFDLDPVTAGLPLPGEHNRLNASAASAVARCSASTKPASRPPGPGRPCADARRGLAADDPSRPTVINDAYNANPTSMRAALSVLADYPAPRVAVLGDMLELGDVTPSAHREIAALAADTAERCVLIGPHFAAAAGRIGLDGGASAPMPPGRTTWPVRIAAELTDERPC